ncbi:hypothetical protein EZV73_18180 [Acidaminobacter sp. JC074]|uniref:hypothetical protein n=1 Tax=Acidaminobacter sp. JC074 TaxID=2530199 RepID=UPI001F11212E|nr:hypothetical protein [Acidaminobacter sp. JC074]MCH4889515.1 hypothetical protein [Acidaminobacter sp. JC074]
METWITIGIIVLVFVLAIIGFNIYRKKQVEKLFVELKNSSKQVPKSKRNSFILLMLSESMSASPRKSKRNDHMAKLNNPKYLEIQMIKMGKLLKDPSTAENKTAEQALKLFRDYQSWEEKSLEENQKTA